MHQRPQVDPLSVPLLPGLRDLLLDQGQLLVLLPQEGQLFLAQADLQSLLLRRTLSPGLRLLVLWLLLGELRRRTLLLRCKMLLLLLLLLLLLDKLRASLLLLLLLLLLLASKNGLNVLLGERQVEV